jgi:hypothetical protein
LVLDQTLLISIVHYVPLNKVALSPGNSNCSEVLGWLKKTVDQTPAQTFHRSTMPDEESDLPPQRGAANDGPSQASISKYKRGTNVDHRVQSPQRKTLMEENQRQKTAGESAETAETV